MIIKVCGIILCPLLNCISFVEKAWRLDDLVALPWENLFFFISHKDNLSFGSCC